MNSATRLNVTALGVVFGVSGFSHGFSEALQGNIPTGSLFISAIGEAQRMWPHGSEPAFTFIPNFLVSGAAAMLVALAIVTWSIAFVHKKNGATILLLLFVLLLLVGGGVAQILFFPWIWLVSTRIHSPLTWWRKILAGKPLRIGRLWPGCLLISLSLLLAVLVIAISGFVPSLHDPEAVISVMLFCLAAEAVFFPLTFITGFAQDVAMNSTPA